MYPVNTCMKRILMIVIAIMLLSVVAGMLLDFSAYRLRPEGKNADSVVMTGNRPSTPALAEPVSESAAWVSPKDVRYAEDAGKILYMTGSSLMLYDVASHEKKVLTVDATIIDYDISRDGKTVAYAARPGDDLQFSAISIFDIESKMTRELKSESESISESGPVFFPDTSKIAYIRRTYDDDYNGALSDGEIWVRDLKEVASERYHLMGDDNQPMIDISKLDKDIRSGHWDGTFFCIDNDSIIGPKMKVRSISADGKHIIYGKSEWVPECSGIDFHFRPANIDGSAFLTSRYIRDYGTATRTEYDGKKRAFEWDISMISWLEDGAFIVRKGLMSLMGGDTSVAYDKNQREKHVFYDTTKDDKRSTHVYDVKPLSGGSFLILYGDTVSKGMFLKQMNLRDASSLDLSREGAFSMQNIDNGTIWNWKIIDDHTISYNKTVDNHIGLFVYDVVSGQEEMLGQLN